MFDIQSQYLISRTRDLPVPVAPMTAMTGFCGAFMGGRLMKHKSRCRPARKLITKRDASQLRAQLVCLRSVARTVSTSSDLSGP